MTPLSFPLPPSSRPVSTFDLTARRRRSCSPSPRANALRLIFRFPECARHSRARSSHRRPNFPDTSIFLPASTINGPCNRPVTKLVETGYKFASDVRARVFLTNALEPPSNSSGQAQFEILFPALAHETLAVNTVKGSGIFTVLVGNPPYSGISANRSEWIESLLKGQLSNGTKITNYYEVAGRPLGERKVWLQDDYVKFVRLAHHLLCGARYGVLSFITNHSFVDSPTCRGMRFQLAKSFSKLRIVDMHGSTKKGEKNPNGGADENVFDILPGVAIITGIVFNKASAKIVSSFDLWGSRGNKFAWLLSNLPSSIKWDTNRLSSPYYLFVPRRTDASEEYDHFLPLRTIFTISGTGIQTSRDEFATDIERSELLERLRDFFDNSITDAEIFASYELSDTRGWKVRDVRRSASFEVVQHTVVEFMYRVFDPRWIALTKDIVDWPRLETSKALGAHRLGLLCSRQQATPGFRHAWIVDGPADMFCLSNKSREGQTIFPLWSPPETGLFDCSSGWRLNVSARARELLTFPNAVSSDDATAAHRILGYIYSVLHSPTYRGRYIDLLKMDYPRVPVPGSYELFTDVARLGTELIALHLLKSDEAPVLQEPARFNPAITFNGTGDARVERGYPSYENGKVMINPTRWFEDVPRATWEFHVGGYQVCGKWLKDRSGRGGKNPRAGRVLTDYDILHYRRIVVALTETRRIMTEIDRVIDEHGGWPGAFAAGMD